MWPAPRRAPRSRATPRTAPLAAARTARRQARARATALLAAILSVLALLAPTVASAHPLGNFTVNRYSRLELAGDGVRIVYVLDMAEIPAFQEGPRIDRDRDGQVDDREREAYADERAEEIRRNLRVELDGAPTPLRTLSRSLSFPPGQGGLQTLRLEAIYAANLPAAAGSRGPVQATYRDGNELNRLGWREIVARPGAAGTLIESSSVPADDQTDELREYPEDLLQSPLDVRDARLTFTPGAASAGPVAGSSRAVERDAGAFASLFADLAAGDLSPSATLFYLMFAMFLGMGHALSPGHGKTVVAAYLVGSRGTAGHAVFLGATVTATHTIGVYALGLVTLYLSQDVWPERLYPILELASGSLVFGIGAWLFVTRLRAALSLRRGRSVAVVGRSAEVGHAHDHGHAHGHADGHEHGHDHDHDHDHAQANGHEPGHDHVHSSNHGRVVALATAPAGAMTAPARVGHGQGHGHEHEGPRDRRPADNVADLHGHDHPHGHDHSHGDHSHEGHHAHGDDDHPHPRDHHHPHDDRPDRLAPLAPDPLVHSHGGVAHSHLPPGADGRPVTWRSLLALGVSGGLIPCPSALVVLLGAIAVHQVGFGLLLIVAFSLGLASVLTGIGLMLVYARRLVDRPGLSSNPIARLIPVASALAIVVVGAAITLQALPRALL